MIISMLDEIAWLFNLRGSDIPYNPVFFSYAAITSTTATIYIDADKLTPEAVAKWLPLNAPLLIRDGQFKEVRVYLNSVEVQEESRRNIPMDEAILVSASSGERTPIHDSNAKGAILGLTLAHTRADIYRAALEGIAFATKHIFDTYVEAGAPPFTG